MSGENRDESIVQLWIESLVALQCCLQLTGQFSEQQIGRLLILSNLSQSDCARSISVRLLDAACGRSGLASGLRRQLLARRLAAGTLASGLLRTSHDGKRKEVSTATADW